jgi:hypothetical protein
MIDRLKSWISSVRPQVRFLFEDKSTTDWDWCDYPGQVKLMNGTLSDREPVLMMKKIYGERFYRRLTDDEMELYLQSTAR